VAEGTQITVAHVVAKDHDDIGLGDGGLHEKGEARKDRERHMRGEAFHLCKAFRGFVGGVEKVGRVDKVDIMKRSTSSRQRSTIHGSLLFVFEFWALGASVGRGTELQSTVGHGGQ
jgi:hypothetical protein